MTRHIKAVAHYMGADVVGIANAHPSFLYAGSRYVQDGTAEDAYQQNAPEELVTEISLYHPSHHCLGLQQAAGAPPPRRRRRVSCLANERHAYSEGPGRLHQRTGLHGAARRGTPQAAGVAGGIGELGRNGLVINKNFGARIHMPDPIMTDLPLVADQPVDIGVEDFCKICRKCANTCPTNSIPFGDKVVHNGIEKYKINWLTCYKLRPYVHDYWGSCLTCAAVCPFTKPNVWWHSLATWTLHTCPIPARPLLVHALKWIDDRFWGVARSSRVRWLSYDSGIKPGDQACTVAGCTASHEGKGQPETWPATWVTTRH